MNTNIIEFHDYVIKGTCPHCSMHVPHTLTKTAFLICKNELIAQLQHTPKGLSVKTDASFQLLGKELTFLAC
ncbi:hypothetical protein [Brevibacillus sp. SYSU BS000544]|uniref:hypothetical protein n=1 Tax=Brevibacillus sp. SYSU BS000544 TaxID=3416443 RepID=UPI003CE46944